MRKILLLFIILVSGTTFASNYVDVHTNLGNVRISLCTGSLFRVQLAHNDTFPENEPWMVRRYKFDEVKRIVNETDTSTSITTESLIIEIKHSPLRIMVSDKNGKKLFSQIPSDIYRSDSSVYCSAILNPDEHFFGFGERMDHLDQRGQLVKLNVELGSGPKPAVGGKDILRANYCPVPMFLSSRGYGIFFHTSYATEWDMGWSDLQKFSFMSKGGDFDFYFIYGPSFYSILDHYTDLTGKSPMLPKFAMGLHLGTYSGGTWKNEQETSDDYPIKLSRRMRKEGIPFDILWLDSTWRLFGEKHGNGGCCFEWRETFKDPASMFRQVYAEHVSMMGLHIRSYLDNGPNYHLLDAAKKEGGILYKDQDIVNFFDSKAVDWWFDNCVKKVTSVGCKFVKTDVGSALRDDSHPELHNIFPLAYAEAPFYKFQNINNMRGLTHTREGYAGIQRYPYIWAGDWGSEWQWFEPIIKAGLNIGMSGVGNWTHCMGGFEQYSPYDVELFIRWCQFGMFSPIAMLFGMDHPHYHEPWTYGDEAMRNFIKYDSLRYTLIPYIYTAEYENHHSGRPIITPLLVDYPNDERTYSISRQYMFGPSMMICPVTTKGALSQTIYFPEGDWFDYNTGELINGRQYKSFLTPLEVLPIFIKAGAIIPQQPIMQYYNEKPVDFITLDVYPYGNTSYDLYEDDGISNDYLSGKYSLTRISSSLEGNKWRLSIDKPVGHYVPIKHGYKITASLGFEPKEITEDGIKLPQKQSLVTDATSPYWYYDKTKNRLNIQLKGNSSANIHIEVY